MRFFLDESSGVKSTGAVEKVQIGKMINNGQQDPVSCVAAVSEPHHERSNF